MHNTLHLHKLYPIKAGAEVYIVCKDKVLMFRRGDNAPAFPGLWVGPGGHVDHDEDFLKAAIREVFEETGVKIEANKIKLKALAIHRRSYSNSTWVLPIFRADLDEPCEIKNSDEGDAKWIEISKLVDMEKIFKPAKFYFDHVLNNKPGILYTNIEWTEDGEFVNVSKSLDKDF